MSRTRVPLLIVDDTTIVPPGVSPTICVPGDVICIVRCAYPSAPTVTRNEPAESGIFTGSALAAIRRYPSDEAPSDVDTAWYQALSGRCCGARASANFSAMRDGGGSFSSITSALLPPTFTSLIAEP